jgi:hypothetical protein
LNSFRASKYALKNCFAECQKKTLGKALGKAASYGVIFSGAIL